MFPTFVIGLREGLEAVLVVSIIATFLRRNGASLRPMWYGVAAAVVLSVGVGVTLQVVEQSLPQRQQEGMETVIGLVAVVFVTGMVLWMSTHARFLKRELEGAAQKALSSGTSVALVAMVFLAVLREGFETSVFLLATFQAASSELSAFVGAVLGILAAVGVGYAMFAGGVRINLARFFAVTSAFLILVAAGLVLSALRTGHEAGWVTIGQGRTVDLSWLAPAGSLRAALVSGVLGMPADPRVVELLGWACYLVPMLVVVLWPSRLRPSAAASRRLLLTEAGGLVVLAVALVVAVPLPQVSVPARAPLAGGGAATVVGATTAEARLLVDSADSRTTLPLVRDPGSSGGGSGSTTWSGTPSTRQSLPRSLTLSRLLHYTGHRVPVGIDITRSPGPYRADWDNGTKVVATTYAGGLVSASSSGALVLTLTGGGLTSERVLTVSMPGAAGPWHVPASYTAQLQERIFAARATHDDRTLWKYWFPGFLALVAAWLAFTSARSGRARRVAGSVVAVLGLTACGSGSGAGSTPGSGTGPGSAHEVGKVGVTLAADGGTDTCALSTDTVAAGPVTFTVDNQSATGITEVELLQDERIVGEKENLAPGLQPVSFTVTLGGGTYQVYCPGGSPELTTLTVTGQTIRQGGSTQALLRLGAHEYATYTDAQVAAMVHGVETLQHAVDAGSLAAAQQAYAEARPYYERIESDVDGFVLPGFKPTDNRGNLDYLIDMRASNLDPAVGWHGFHAVERDLFGRRQITASTRKLAAELTRNVKTLEAVVRTVSYKPEDLANGAASLLEEVQSSKITGEEEHYSHLDLVDFAANLEGAKEAFAYLEPGLRKIDAGMTDQIRHRFDQTDALLDRYRDAHALGGYERWTPALRAKAANRLSQSVQALQDSLSTLAQKVVTA